MYSISLGEEPDFYLVDVETFAALGRLCLASMSQHVSFAHEELGKRFERIPQCTVRSGIDAERQNLRPSNLVFDVSHEFDESGAISPNLFDWRGLSGIIAAIRFGASGGRYRSPFWEMHDRHPTALGDELARIGGSSPRFLDRVLTDNVISEVVNFGP